MAIGKLRGRLRRGGKLHGGAGTTTAILRRETSSHQNLHRKTNPVAEYDEDEEEEEEEEEEGVDEPRRVEEEEEEEELSDDRSVTEATHLEEEGDYEDHRSGDPHASRHKRLSRDQPPPHSRARDAARDVDDDDDGFFDAGDACFSSNSASPAAPVSAAAAAKPKTVERQASTTNVTWLLHSILPSNLLQSPSNSKNNRRPHQTHPRSPSRAHLHSVSFDDAEPHQQNHHHHHHHHHHFFDIFRCVLASL